MKRNLYFGALLAITGAMIWSCNKEDFSSEQKTDNIETRSPDDVGPDDRILPEDMEYVGIQHNEGLETVYQNYVDLGTPDSETESKDRVKDIMIDQVMMDDEMAPAVKEFTLDGLDYLYGNPPPQTIDNFYSGAAFDEVTDETGEELGATEKAYLDELYMILSEGEDTDISPDAMSTDIAGLESTIYADMSLDNNSLFVLFSATQVARYSYSYWYHNLWKWEGWYGPWPHCIPVSFVFHDVWAIVNGQWRLLIYHPYPLGAIGWWHYGYGYYGYGYTYYSCFSTLYITHACIWHWCWWYPYYPCWW